MPRFRSTKRLVFLALIASTACAAPASALADDLTAGNVPDLTAGACARALLGQPFAPWGDSSDYALIDNGGLENADTGWSLSGGAQVVAGNEPFYANDPSDGFSLSLPRGSSAVTPPICISQQSPLFRFFDSSDGSDGAGLKVEVLFANANGKVRSPTVARIDGTGVWGPSDPLPVVADQQLGPAETTEVAVRFTARGGAWAVDDVFVDPWHH